MLLPGRLWMVTVISCAHSILKIEGNIWLEGGLPNQFFRPLNFSPPGICHISPLGFHACLQGPSPPSSMQHQHDSLVPG